MTLMLTIPPAGAPRGAVAFPALRQPARRRPFMRLVRADEVPFAQEFNAVAPAGEAAPARIPALPEEEDGERWDGLA